MHSGNAAAMPLVRNEATFSFCHASRSVRITTAILVSNCMMAPVRRVSFRDAPLGADPESRDSGFASSTRPGMTDSLTLAAAARGLERLRGVDIEKRTVAFDRDFRHRLAMPGDQMAGADIAVERHQLLEEAARPQHRIAAP